MRFNENIFIRWNEWYSVGRPIIFLTSINGDTLLFYEKGAVFRLDSVLSVTRGLQLLIDQQTGADGNNSRTSGKHSRQSCIVNLNPLTQESAAVPKV